MLDATLATQFVPGTNVKGEVAGANWLFLLPNLELDQTLCVGAPRRATLKALSQVSRKVIVVDVSRRELRRLRAEGQLAGLENVEITAMRLSALPVEAGSIELLVLARTAQAFTSTALVKCQPMLKRDGLIYFEVGGLLGGLPGLQKMRQMNGWGQRVYWSTPWHGELRTAVPQQDCETINYFVRRSLNRGLMVPGTLEWVRRLGKTLSLRRPPPSETAGRPRNGRNSRTAPHGLIARSVGLGLARSIERVEHFITRQSGLAGRYSVLLSSGTSCLTEQLPQYLRMVALEAGIDLGSYRWGLSAPADFNSRKVLFYLFHRDKARPEYVVKLTRDPALNFRLENEYRALVQLQERGVGDRETLPRVAFFGYHAKRAILGETLIDGEPFREKALARTSSPYFQAALEWLLQLSVVTAERTAATPREVAACLQTLFERFIQIYWLPPAHRDFILLQIETIRRSPEAFPVVFEHGDPGVWNLLATPDGQTAFLDWEAAEVQGFPLWDLFYFLRSYIVSIGRAQGIRDGLDAFRELFLAESPLSRLAIQAVECYRRRIGLSPQLVGPLFYTCWMHRALKESTRLAPSKLESGHYVTLLRLCIQEGNAAGLRRLVALS